MKIDRFRQTRLDTYSMTIEMNDLHAKSSSKISTVKILRKYFGTTSDIFLSLTSNTINKNKSQEKKNC